MHNPPRYEHEHRTTPSGVNRVTENALIGVELTYITPDGMREELMMLVPPGGRFILPRMQNSAWGRGQMQVTLHTSDGDRQANISL